jgi:Domain of unknown function (DUF4352)
MRTRALIAASAVTAGLFLAGCGSVGSSVNTSPANTPAAKSTAKSAAANAPSSKAAGLGDTIDVSDEAGNKLAVTLLKIDANTKDTDGYSTPPSGDAYYAAQVRIKNVGSAAWSDSPSNCMVVKDAKGQAFQTGIVLSISSGPLLPTAVTIAPGDSALGWIVFNVTKGDKVTQVQFTPLSGMGNDTAQWSLS